MGAETGEGGLADSGDVEERLGRLEGAVDVAVIDQTPGKCGADAGELRELDGPCRVEVDGEPEWDGGGGVVVVGARDLPVRPVFAPVSRRVLGVSRRHRLCRLIFTYERRRRSSIHISAQARSSGNLESSFVRKT